MELRTLRYFAESARLQSMTRAAESLHVTQPTLSRQLKELEDELGQKLFVRGSYSIHLTPEGEILYKRACDMLSIADRTLREFGDMKEFNGGDVYIGCAESQGIRYLAKAAKSLQERYPGFRINIFSGNAESVMERLRKGLLDFAVIVKEVSSPEYYDITIPHKDIWGLLMRKDSPLLAHKEIPVEMLSQLPLIASAQTITREMSPWFADNRDRLNIVATYNLSYNASLLVQEGIGYAMVFEGLIHTGGDSILSFRPITPAIVSPMHVIWGRQQLLSKAAQLFKEELLSVLNVTQSGDGTD